MLQEKTKREVDAVIQDIRRLDELNQAIVYASIQNLLARQRMEEEQADRNRKTA